MFQSDPDSPADGGHLQFDCTDDCFGKLGERLGEIEGTEFPGTGKQAI